MFDFGVGYSELFVLALVAIIVIGPKDLPKVLRTFGQMMTKMRGMAREFQGHVDVAMKDAGVADLKKDMQSLKNMASLPNTDIKKEFGISMPDAKSNDFKTHFANEPGETRIAGERSTQS